jgi:tRNA 2-thiouridine synthesizing protein A
VSDAEPDVLDTKGLLCPMPVIRTQDRVRLLEHGMELVVVATDPGVMHDIPAWCRVHGHEVITAFREGRLCTIRLRVNKP